METMELLEINHGTPVFLREINQNAPQWIGKEIRVIGSLIYHDIDAEIGVLQQYLDGRESFLMVDMNLDLLESGSIIKSTKCSRIPKNIRGRLTDTIINVPDLPILKARIVRNVQGINMSLYQQIIKLRRQFDSRFNEMMEKMEKNNEMKSEKMESKMKRKKVKRFE
ncbi:5792_t:CDS:2 [Diversispora eburnea]|uniref:5792_t:CDS:1 n=1 Tax=Diversispora eburnea TaxID=1213867 RepID=A0A9N8ZWX5_9GLOM|nr:5792_t:CDS:2 [Diversispora eburnea]